MTTEKCRIARTELMNTRKLIFLNMGGRTHQAKEVERFSSVSRMTVFKSCSESDTGEESPSSQKNHISSTSAETFQALKLCNQRKQKAATDRKHQRGCMEDSKQLSPVSVLELPSDEEQHCPRTRQEETPSASSFILLKKVTEDSIFSASMWELLIQSPIEKQSCVEFAELQDIIGSSSSQYLKTKRGLMQPKHLLSDGIREAVETYGRKGIRRRLLQGCLGPEELGKHICEKICSWGKQYGNATNITQLINSDISVSLQEWSDFQPVIMEIGMEIGNAILEEIRNEIIRDMIDFLH
ncbi:hypothetical protein HHK36_031055 [Tetracentron sinense]|uniref:DUF4378 domain-containing protein n=1 Tax=Tetracentron sinense TaxID=13715 RepID=A0A834YD90_TETSI|nr:hypothetical protein HHK36_031055 [Tetracentron sinense]